MGNAVVKEEISFPKAFVYEGEAYLIGDIEILNDIPALRLTVSDAWGNNSVPVLLDAAFFRKDTAYIDEETPFKLQLLHAARRVLAKGKI